MARKLKVFRTAIGFHDAYVAAPSRKAALEAWGTTKDLFSRGVAEEIDDAALSKEPLASPGKVIRRSRGTAAEQIAALPKDEPHAKKRPSAEVGPVARARKAKSAPKPSRAELEEADRELEQARRRHDDELADIEHKKKELDRRRLSAVSDFDAEQRKLERLARAARDKYEKAMADWEP